MLHRSLIAFGIALALAVPGTAVAQEDAMSPQIFTDHQRAVVERYTSSPEYQAVLREVKAVNAAQPAQVQPDGGLDWGDAGIGAAGMLVVALGALGGVVAVNHRRTAMPR